MVGCVSHRDADSWLSLQASALCYLLSFSGLAGFYPSHPPPPHFPTQMCPVILSQGSLSLSSVEHKEGMILEPHLGQQTQKLTPNVQT